MATSVGKRRSSVAARSRSVLVEPKRAVPTPPDPTKEENDLLDWDVWLEETPARPERTVLVRFERAGRDQPMPIGSLEDE